MHRMMEWLRRFEMVAGAKRDKEREKNCKPNKATSSNRNKADVEAGKTNGPDTLFEARTGVPGWQIPFPLPVRARQKCRPVTQQLHKVVRRLTLVSRKPMVSKNLAGGGDRNVPRLRQFAAEILGSSCVRSTKEEGLEQASWDSYGPGASRRPQLLRQRLNHGEPRRSKNCGFGLMS